jgi:hypothetical protein
VDELNKEEPVKVGGPYSFLTIVGLISRARVGINDCLDHVLIYLASHQVFYGSYIGVLSSFIVVIAFERSSHANFFKRNFGTIFESGPFIVQNNSMSHFSYIG